ncbi:hypothetical protein [Millisia brevis]|uniref:hypothetical protein n=1 Tax=Millisia brevis TaxID=264148 RepID=UPI00082D82DD|nr:hypothetical protein [Millisia brevis]
MGTHRRAQAGPRGVSRGVLIAAVSVVVLVVLVFGWMRLRDASAEQGTEAAQRCVEGDTTLRVAADPTIADTVRQIADSFDATDPVIRDRCVRVQVDAVDAATATAAITGVDPAAAPDLWIAPDSAAAARVADRAASTPRSFAASPVVVAASGAAADALRAANPTWGALPGLLGQADAPIPLLPVGAATTAAGSAMVADALGLGAAAPAETDMTSPAAVRVLANIGAASVRGDSPAPADTAAALDAVAGSPTAVTFATFATAQQIGLRPDLEAITPVGAAPVADYPAVVLQTPSGADDSVIAIAGELLNYARDTGADTIRSAGFVPVEEIPGARAADSPAVADLVASAFAQPIGVSTTTLLVDISPPTAAAVSGTGAAGTDTIRDAVGAAIGDVLQRLPDGTRVGLVTFGRTDATPLPYQLTIPAATLSSPGTEGSATHRDRILTALEAWPQTGSSDTGITTTADAYATLINRYRTAVADRVADMPNRVVVISVAPNADGTLSPTTATTQLAAAIDPAEPVQVDAILIGSGPDTAEWGRLTAATGGRTEQLGTAAGFELPNLLTTMF